MAFIIGEGIDIGSGITITYEYPVAPSVIVDPYILGTPQVRLTLTVYPGTWDPGIPQPILGYLYQWQTGTTDIPGETSNTITIPYTVAGTTLRCRVTAYNDALQTAAYTLNTANVIPNIPLPPSSATATLGTLGNVTIAFTPNVDNGGANVDVFYANSNTGNYIASNAASPITIQPTNLGNYTFNVVAHNIVGNSAPTTTNSVNVTLTPTFQGNISIPTQPYTLVASPDNKFLYVGVNAAIRRYSIDQTTGNLTFLGNTTVTPGIPGFINMNNAGNCVYLVEPGGTDVRQWSRNITTGALTPLGSDATGGTQYNNIVVSADGQNLYADGANGTTLQKQIAVFTIAADGQLTRIQNLDLDLDTSGTQSRGLAISPDGKNVYFQVANPGLTIRRIYKFNRNTTTGLLTADGYIIPTPAFGPNNLTISYDNEDVYVSYIGGTTGLSRYSRNTTTGNLTFVSTVSGGINATNQAIIPTTDNIIYTGTGSFFRNVDTGNLTFTSSNTALTFSQAGDEGIITKNNIFIYTLNGSANRIERYKVV